MEANIVKCKKCNWQGSQKELGLDTVETCMGSDKVEICPVCGSLELASKSVN